jgi:hypothetical protein
MLMAISAITAQQVVVTACHALCCWKNVLHFLDTWVPGGLDLGGLDLGGLGLGVGIGLPQALHVPCECVSVGHVRTLLSSSACRVRLSFLQFLHVLCIAGPSKSEVLPFLPESQKARITSTTQSCQFRHSNVGCPRRQERHWYQSTTHGNIKQVTTVKTPCP